MRYGSRLSGEVVDVPFLNVLRGRLDGSSGAVHAPWYGWEPDDLESAFQPKPFCGV